MDYPLASLQHWLGSENVDTKSFWKHKVYKKPLQFISFSNCCPENVTILNLLNTPYETVVLNSASQVKPQEAKGGKIKSFPPVLFIPQPEALLRKHLKTVCLYILLGDKWPAYDRRGKPL